MSEVQTVPHEAREDVTHEEGPTPEFEPLFEDEGGFSEEQLSGESQESVEDTTEKTDESETPAPADEKPKEADEAKEEKPKEEPAEKKPPEGFVEIQALHAERHKRRETEERFQRELDQLKAELYAKQQKPQEEKADPWKDFKVLSDDEFAALKEEDPDEAITYLRKEQNYREHQRAKEAEKAAEARSRYQEDQILSRAWEKINDVIPDVFERDKPEVQETITALNKFAEEQGFSPDEIAVLSNPATRVIVKDRKTGQERVAMMADAAATFVKLLHGYSKANGASLTKEQEDAIRKEEREKTIAEVTARVKKGETEFRSLVDAPTTSEKPKAAHGNLTEGEWAKLPESERRRLLGG